MARDIMIKQAAEALLRLADMMEAEDEEGTEAPAPVAEASFKCSGCGHAVPLSEINAKNQEAAGDAQVDLITAEDRVRCPECDGGILAVAPVEDAPADVVEEAPVEEESTGDEVAAEGAEADKTLEDADAEDVPAPSEEVITVKKEEPEEEEEKEASAPNLSVWASLISNASESLGL